MELLKLRRHQFLKRYSSDEGSRWAPKRKFDDMESSKVQEQERRSRKGPEREDIVQFSEHLVSKRTLEDSNAPLERTLEASNAPLARTQVVRDLAICGYEPKSESAKEETTFVTQDMKTREAVGEAFATIMEEETNMSIDDTSNGGWLNSTLTQSLEKEQDPDNLLTNMAEPFTSRFINKTLKTHLKQMNRLKFAYRVLFETKRGIEETDSKVDSKLGSDCLKLENLCSQLVSEEEKQQTISAETERLEKDIRTTRARILALDPNKMDSTLMWWHDWYKQQQESLKHELATQIEVVKSLEAKIEEQILDIKVVEDLLKRSRAQVDEALKDFEKLNISFHTTIGGNEHTTTVKRNSGEVADARNLAMGNDTTASSVDGRHERAASYRQVHETLAKEVETTGR